MKDKMPREIFATQTNANGWPCSGDWDNYDEASTSYTRTDLVQPLVETLKKIHDHNWDHHGMTTEQHIFWLKAAAKLALAEFEAAKVE